MVAVAVVGSLWVLWIFYLAVMSLYRAHHARTLSLPAKLLGYPTLAVGAPARCGRQHHHHERGVCGAPIRMAGDQATIKAHQDRRGLASQAGRRDRTSDARGHKRHPRRRP